MPARFACGHPASSENTYVSKTTTGPNAGRVGYTCKTCHAATVRRARQRAGAEQHDWQAALTVRVHAGIAERYAQLLTRDKQPHRIRQHHQATLVEVYCRRCRRTWPAPGPCRRPA